MVNPWDPFPFPATADPNESDTYYGVGEVLSQWEFLEFTLARMAGGGSGSQSGSDVRDIGGVKFLGRVVEGIATKELKGLVDESKTAVGSGVVALIGVGDDGKAGIVVGVTDDLTDRFNAVDLVRAASTALGGRGGGGRPDMD